LSWGNDLILDSLNTGRIVTGDIWGNRISLLDSLWIYNGSYRSSLSNSYLRIKYNTDSLFANASRIVLTGYALIEDSILTPKI